MPCYMFTYHGKATWMPDHPRGYVHRTYGLQPRDAHMAAHYRLNQREPAVHFTAAMQDLMIDTARSAGRFLAVIAHGVALEPTHVHVVLSWRHHRTWKSMRASVRSAMSRALNESFEKRDWFSDSPSRKRIRNHAHFDYLMMAYLPKHSRHWVRHEDVQAAEQRDSKRQRSVRDRGRKHS